MASRRWRRVHESRARVAVCLERLCAAAREGIRLDAGADVVGLYGRGCVLRGFIRTGGPNSGPPGAARLRRDRRDVGWPWLRPVGLDDVAVVPLRDFRSP